MSFKKFATILILFLSFAPTDGSTSEGDIRGLESGETFLKVSAWRFLEGTTPYELEIKSPQDLWNLWKERLPFSRWPVHINRLTPVQANQLFNHPNFFLDILAPLSQELSKGTKSSEKISVEATLLAKQILQVEHANLMLYISGLREMAFSGKDGVAAHVVALMFVENLAKEFMESPLPLDNSRGYFTPLEHQLFTHHAQLPRLATVASYKDAFQTIGIYGGLFDWTKELNIQDIRKNFTAVVNFFGRSIEAHESFVTVAFFHANNPYYPDYYTPSYVLEILKVHIPGLLSKVLGVSPSVYKIESLQDFMHKQVAWTELLKAPLDFMRTRIHAQDTLLQNAMAVIEEEKLEDELWTNDLVTPENAGMIDLRYQIVLNKVNFLRRFVLIKSLEKLNDTIEMLLENDEKGAQICFTRFQGIFEATGFLHKEYEQVHTKISEEYERFRRFNIIHHMTPVE